MITSSGTARQHNNLARKPHFTNRMESYRENNKKIMADLLAGKFAKYGIRAYPDGYLEPCVDIDKNPEKYFLQDILIMKFQGFNDEEIKKIHSRIRRDIGDKETRNEHN